MDHAAGAPVLRRVVDPLRESFRGLRAARIERMKQRGGRIAVRIDPHDAVPERVDGDGRGLDVFAAHLRADIAERARRDGRQVGRRRSPSRHPAWCAPGMEPANRSPRSAVHRARKAASGPTNSRHPA